MFATFKEDGMYIYIYLKTDSVQTGWPSAGPGMKMNAPNFISDKNLVIQLIKSLI